MPASASIMGMSLCHCGWLSEDYHPQDTVSKGIVLIWMKKDMFRSFIKNAAHQ